MISISQDGSAEEAARLPVATGARFPVVLDSTGAIFAAYGVSFIPHNVMIDRSGRIAGVPGGSGMDLDAAVRETIGG